MNPRRARFLVTGAALALLALTAMTVTASDYPANLPEKRLVIEGPAGQTSTIRVRVARTPADRSRGMQDLGPAAIRANPMWFVFPQDRRTGWHMRNVAIPLVIAYVAADGQVVATERMQPGRSGYGIDRPIRYALEVAASRAAALGLEAGARIRPVGGGPRN